MHSRHGTVRTHSPGSPVPWARHRSARSARGKSEISQHTPQSLTVLSRRRDRRPTWTPKSRLAPIGPAGCCARAIAVCPATRLAQHFAPFFCVFVQATLSGALAGAVPSPRYTRDFDTRTTQDSASASDLDSSDACVIIALFGTSDRARVCRRRKARLGTRDVGFRLQIIPIHGNFSFSFIAGA